MALTLAVLCACAQRPVELGGRPCRQGECLDGWLCSPFSKTCVARQVIDCQAADALCPERILTGDPCQDQGALIPCASRATTCEHGCRICGADGTWSGCALPECEIWREDNCAACGDDCSARVRHAVPVCLVTGGAPACAYRGACQDGFVDHDGEVANGCECDPSRPEVCDGVDNNCDSQADEGLAACQCTTGPQSPEICDAVDNDCDQRIDEVFACALSSQEPCTVGPGASPGARTCSLPICTLGPCVADDQAPPAVATGFTAVTGDTVLSLAWVYPADVDLATCVLVQKDGATPPATPADGVSLQTFSWPGAGSGASYTVLGLTNDQTYSYAVFCEDAAGNWQLSVTGGNSGSGTPRFGSVQNPTDVVAEDRVAGESTITYTAAAGVNGCVIRRKIGSCPARHDDGDAVGPEIGGSGAKSRTDSGGLSPCEVYAYAVFCRKGGSWNDVVAAGQNCDTAITEPWWLPNHEDRVALVVKAPPPVALTDVPVLVTLNPSRVDFGRLLSGGADLAFLDPGGGALLPYEVESYRVGTEVAYVWVKVPELSAAPAKDCIFMYYGNNVATTNTPTAVWSGAHGAVWHLAGRRSPAPHYLDATSFDNDLEEGAGGPLSLAPGVVGLGLAFNGDPQYVFAADAAALEPAAALTLSAWIKPTDWAGNRRVIQKGALDNGYRLLVEGEALLFHVNNVGTVTTATPPQLGAWSLVAGTFDGAALRLYVNGARVGSVTASGTVPDTASNLRLGAKEPSGNATDLFKGTMDEVRLESVGRSDAWMALQYLTMIDLLFTYRAPEAL
ncbi:MAG: DUF2341 domain-containing protein [Deltaproteobacteria bacterium]|nr:DUF2341 domain-containing protein [Deltaproteobacteria bacterium]